MLRRGFVVDFRPATHALALLVASAVLLSTSRARAQSENENGGDTPSAHFAEEDAEDSASPENEPWAALIRTGSIANTGFVRTAVVNAAVDGSTVVEVATPPTSPTRPAPQPQPNDDGSGLRTVGYIAGGVGIVGFVLFAVAGIGAKNTHDRLYEDCHAGPCTDPAHQNDIEDGKLFQTAANIGLATGLAGIGLGAALVVAGNHSGSETTPAVGMSATGGMITYGARF